MQEETTQKTIALAIKTFKLTASVLQKAMKMYLEHQKHKEPSHGKIPVKKLVGQGAGAKSIEVTDDNVKAFERVAELMRISGSDAIIVMDNEVWYCIDGLPNRCLAIW